MARFLVKHAGFLWLALSACSSTPAPKAAEHGPDDLPPELAQCRLLGEKVHPSQNEPSAGCELELDCGEHLSVDCDPEEDGTHTSLCGCQRNGKPDHVVQGQLFKDDASACRAAAIVCLAPRAGQEP